MPLASLRAIVDNKPKGFGEQPDTLEIEAEINRRRGEVDLPSEIPINNFRGIELRDFPAEIARLALIIAEFQCDVLYRGQKEALKDVLPLDSQNWISATAMTMPGSA